MSTKTTYRVSIGNRTTRVHVPNNLIGAHDLPADESDAEEYAFNRALRKLYGKSAGWFPNSGLDGYGQVTRPAKFGGYDCITAQVVYEITAESKFPVRHTERNAAIDQMRADIEQDRADEEAGYNAGYAGEKLSLSASYYFGVGHQNGMRAAGK